MVVEEIIVKVLIDQPRRYRNDNSAPVYEWASAVSPIDEKTNEQINYLTKLPFVIDHLAFMPDAHAGYGMPIGGVLFADNAVVPYAIGVDIGCGVQLARTNLVWSDNFDKEKLKNVLHQIQRDVPAGVNRTHKRAQVDLEELVRQISMKVGSDSALYETKGLMAWVEKALNAVGTLGSGNHFIEAQRDEENNVYLMLHSGSRNLGKMICDHYAKLAYELNQKWHSNLPHRELAYLPAGTPEYRGYMSAMNFALAWAEINRNKMMEKAEYAFKKHASVKDFDVIVDVHHNFAAWENHYGKNGIVHRKGAVRAREGELVLIPGSMGTNSYIAKGLGNKESFNTCQHGAGRAFGRKQMQRQMTSDEVFQDMKDRGVELVINDKGSAQEEAVMAYKDVDAVMAASADLVEPVTKLWPLGVVKG